MSDNKVEVIQKKTILDLFIDGARKGFTIGTTSLLPNVMMAFVIIRILDVTGLLQLIGVVFQPVMGLWGLPGEAATVLITALIEYGWRCRCSNELIYCWFFRCYASNSAFTCYLFDG